jgi:transposase
LSSFSGLGKGPGIFWEKSWGTIGAESYCEHIVPILESYIRETGLLLMQDNASGHAARATLAYMGERGLFPIFWLVNSPDLNPIETLWDRIKDYIDQKYLEIHRSYPKLKAAVIEAWESITQEEVFNLITSNVIPKRCQAVIKAKGWHTKY